jgi:HD-GYP domain-containing protein (c-di-GMP phosphodiesterase class II)
MRKPQIQRLCELYQEEEYLWNIQSQHYFKKEKRNAALNQLKKRTFCKFKINVLDVFLKIIVKVYNLLLNYG